MWRWLSLSLSLRLQVERTPKKNLPDEDGVIIPPQTPIRWEVTSISWRQVDWEGLKSFTLDWGQRAEDRGLRTGDWGLRLSSGLGSGLLMSDLFLCLCRVFRAAMTSIQQLRGDLISTGDTPSTTLTTYFKVSEKKWRKIDHNRKKTFIFLNLYKLLIQNCTVDPTQGVLKRLEMLDQRFSQRFGQAVGPRCVLLGNQVKKK